MPSQVMVIPDELREIFRKQVVETTNEPELRLRRMVAFMLDKEGLGLQYKADASNTVAESYRTRQVNCLSFTLMAVALAREAGLKAQGQQIDRILAWNLVGNVVMQNLHANAVITLKDRNLMVKNGRDFVLDIAASGLYTQDYMINRFTVSDERMLASFYGNRAMELLTNDRLAESNTWLNKALDLEPDDATLWNNAGVLSQRMGEAATAESNFLRAANMNPRLMSALYNLEALYHGRGDVTRAAYWRERADRVLRDDPFYQFSLAERKAQSGDFAGAIPYYKRAISLYKRERLFHSSLAIAYYHVGRLRDADSELGIAQQMSDGVDRQRYEAKRDALHRLVY